MGNAAQISDGCRLTFIFLLLSITHPGACWSTSPAFSWHTGTFTSADGRTTKTVTLAGWLSSLRWPGKPTDSIHELPLNNNAEFQDVIYKDSDGRKTSSERSAVYGLSDEDESPMLQWLENGNHAYRWPKKKTAVQKKKKLGDPNKNADENESIQKFTDKVASSQLLESSSINENKPGKGSFTFTDYDQVEKNWKIPNRVLGPIGKRYSNRNSIKYKDGFQNLSKKRHSIRNLLTNAPFPEITGIDLVEPYRKRSFMKDLSNVKDESQLEPNSLKALDSKFNEISLDESDFNQTDPINVLSPTKSKRVICCNSNGCRTCLEGMGAEEVVNEYFNFYADIPKTLIEISGLGRKQSESCSNLQIPVFPVDFSSYGLEPYWIKKVKLVGWCPSILVTKELGSNSFPPKLVEAQCLCDKSKCTSGGVDFKCVPLYKRVTTWIRRGRDRTEVFSPELTKVRIACVCVQKPSHRGGEISSQFL